VNRYWWVDNRIVDLSIHIEKFMLQPSQVKVPDRDIELASLFDQLFNRCGVPRYQMPENAGQLQRSLDALIIAQRRFLEKFPWPYKIDRAIGAYQLKYRQYSQIFDLYTQIAGHSNQDAAALVEKLNQFSKSMIMDIGNACETGAKKIEAVSDQMAARAESVEKALAPLTKLYPKTEMAEIRKPAKPVARFENNFSVAMIPQKSGKEEPLTIEQELRDLIEKIIGDGGNMPRTKLRSGKSDTYQPEKLLQSKVAKRLIKAGLLGKSKSGRTTVFWAKESVA
jgi:hypothetical protein